MMEKCSRTGSPFLLEMAPGMAARTQPVKEVAREKRNIQMGEVVLLWSPDTPWGSWPLEE